MMSIFSSFDAVCAEFFGVAVGSSAIQPKEEAKVGSAQNKVLKTVEERKKNSSKPQKWLPRNTSAATATTEITVPYPESCPEITIHYLLSSTGSFANTCKYALLAYFGVVSCLP
ncbi:hypothetical protein NE237_023022 [Protea cynaroides]|uniref:Uncharacterized protein n=1 Tax=Protea cynaroides TaxID=273540 RepID=A0A9Q0HE45_9MAGN|nr:hypothetical protein NE237_023022 [Protea cynaroides]